MFYSFERCFTLFGLPLYSFPSVGVNRSGMRILWPTQFLAVLQSQPDSSGMYCLLSSLCERGRGGGRGRKREREREWEYWDLHSPLLCCHPSLTRVEGTACFRLCVWKRERRWERERERILWQWDTSASPCHHELAENSQYIVPCFAAVPAGCQVECTVYFSLYVCLSVSVFLSESMSVYMCLCVCACVFWRVSVALLMWDPICVSMSVCASVWLGVQIPLAMGFFQVKSYQWLKNWHSSAYPARRLALQGQHWDWLARCQYTVTGWGRKFDLQLLSQCGST